MNGNKGNRKFKKERNQRNQNLNEKSSILTELQID